MEHVLPKDHPLRALYLVTDGNQKLQPTINMLLRHGVESCLEYAKNGIRSNVIMPGLMNTPMIIEPLKHVYGGGDIAVMMEKRTSQCPMGRMGDAWDVAHAALYLASEESKYVTAAEMLVDGGITAKFA